ncbi:EH signature domain-containing protein [Pseudomonas aeruginosa]|uniref:EH signature domain-containing protein n=1 Tax=Pseudomonas aeruginosa TaxID=287 RepID=UPI002FE0B27E
MRLPPLDLPAIEWGAALLERWTVLVSKANQMEANTGNNDAFERMVAVLRNMGSSGRFEGLAELLKRRLTARALTWLWLNDEAMASRLLNPRLLEVLLEAQQPRLTRITLQQLAQLYFRRFDRLDDREGLRELLEQTLQQQLEKMPPRKIQGAVPDPLMTLKNEGWLLGIEGPSKLASKVREEGRELGETLSSLGLQGFDDGRYGDICRAHFYLETLRDLPLGEWDPVMDELLKPSVSKAPFEGGKRIGHVALEILIDRIGQEPSDAWQNFILSLAGDPRIASTASNYREWWLPLGEARIQRVRGWLSKEDLRLFLQAVEQFGIETQNDDLQRMFPARKLFLEGLFKLKLIRNTRLLLGGKAQQSVKRILGKDVKTSFARMDGPMNDKAVIYLDCGDFHLVEGSHSFKIWVYLAAPGEALRSYERNTFSHFDLITTIPGAYKKLYPALPFEAVTHNGHWQNKVFSFLADNGIGLDVEQLLSRNDYKLQLSKFGIPAVNARRTAIPQTVTVEAPPSKAVTRQVEPQVSAPSAVQRHTGLVVDSIAVSEPGAHQQAASKASDVERIKQLKPSALKVLRYFADNPGDKVRYAANVFGVEAREINQILYGPLKGLCVQDDSYGWHLTDAARQQLTAFDQQQ